ncbi:hypothetical protein GJAV_G00204710 [Gymnothorax javanicus]|nr:hypothetical protein GJAV_G00204710 [Gymnothorax javanicus]
MEKETLKRIIENQQESLNRRKNKGGRKPGGRGRGGKREDGRRQGKVQYQGKKTTFDSDDEDAGEAAAGSPKKRGLDEGNGEDAGEPAAKHAKTGNGSAE